MGADRKLIRAGFILLCCALVTGFAIPAFLNPKMALAAHVTGVLNALLLVAAGLCWPLLALSQRLETMTRGLLLFATFTNWAGSCLAAAWGTSRLTPLSSIGHSAAAWKESIVQLLQVSVALAVLTAAVIVVYALRPAAQRS